MVCLIPTQDIMAIYSSYLSIMSLNSALNDLSDPRLGVQTGSFTPRCFSSGRPPHPLAGHVYHSPAGHRLLPICVFASPGPFCGGILRGGSCAPRRQRDIVLISRHREIGRVASPGAVHEINENESSPGCCRAPYQAAGSLGRLVPHRDLVYLEFFQPPKKKSFV